MFTRLAAVVVASCTAVVRVLFSAFRCTFATWRAILQQGQHASVPRDLSMLHIAGDIDA